MNKDEKSLFPIYVSALFGVVTIVSGFLWGSVLPSLLAALAIVVLGTGFPAPNAGLQIVAYLVSWIVFCLSAVVVDFGRGIPFGELAVASLALGYPAALAFLSVGPEKKRPAMAAGFVILAVSVFSSFHYIKDYLYLYTTSTNYSLMETLMRLSLITVLLALVFGAFNKDRRNPYVAFFCVVTAFFGFAMSFASGSGLSLQILSAPSSWYSLSALSIYIYAGKKSQRTYERRMVTFSNMVYEELKPIKKRKKARKFDVPPNVPVLRRDRVADMEKTDREN